MSRATGASLYGVVGGMGPLASAEFIKTVYELGLREREQEMPAVLLHSDPSYPDRTDAFLRGEDAPLLLQLTAALEQLCALGASRVVICCMTIHYLLPRLAPSLRERVWSLLDVIADELETRGGRHLLICSSGTRQLRLFEEHPRWPSFSQYLVIPGEEDQQRIHRELIYPIKLMPNVSTLFPLLGQALDKYEVDSFVVGCSEIHLLAKHYAVAGGRAACLDPFKVVARRMAEGRV